MDPAEVLSKITGSNNYEGQIVHIEDIEAQDPIYEEINFPLHPHLQEYLKCNGIDKLYSHQAAAFNKVIKGESVVVVTPTASGKTLCYNLPVLDRLLNNSDARALYIFPAKSLSQDQLKVLNSFDSEIKAAIYDGDTPDVLKQSIREETRVVITNPDMLHQGILPNHIKWHSFFSNLKFIVIDELHHYRGVFGTHVSHIMRRIRRICSHYGSNPQFIMCSATIANPQEHAERLTGMPVSLIDNNGAPKGKKKFVLWKPPVNRPYLQDTIWLLSFFTALKIRTITFAKARQTAERILRRAKKLLQNRYPLKNLDGVLASYRGGYLPHERRAVEKALFEGDIYGVVSTNALELGIDVGELEVCIIAGYPGTIASTWQQAGRAGRRLKDSLVIFIGVENPLDQYFIRNSHALFSKSIEKALIAPDNPYILMGHVLCAAHELPIKPEHHYLWEDVFSDLLVLLEEDKKLVETEGVYYYMGEKYPAAEVNIRTSSSSSFRLKDKSFGNRLVGLIDYERALSETHPEAVYMHQGETFVVTDLDIENKDCYLKRVDVEYYTMAKRDKATEIIAADKKREIFSHFLFAGTLKVTSKVTGYIKKHEMSGQVLGGGNLELPEQILETHGMWLTFNSKTAEKIKENGFNFMGGIHAIEHAAIGLLPLLAMCDRNDIGGLSVIDHFQTQSPTLFIHDAYNGGVGFSETAYFYFEELMEKTLESLQECSCEVGCPSCIYSPKCSNFNRPLDKETAIFLLHELLAKEYSY